MWSCPFPPCFVAGVGCPQRRGGGSLGFLGPRGLRLASGFCGCSLLVMITCFVSTTRFFDSLTEGGVFEARLYLFRLLWPPLPQISMLLTSNVKLLLNCLVYRADPVVKSMPCQQCTCIHMCAYFNVQLSTFAYVIIGYCACFDLPSTHHNLYRGQNF